METDFGHFGVINFYRSQMQHMFIYVNMLWSTDEIIGFIGTKQIKRPQKAIFIAEYKLNKW